MRHFLLFCGLLWSNLPLIHGAEELPPAGKFSLPRAENTATEWVKQFQKSTGLTVDLTAIETSITVPGQPKELSYWESLQYLADQTSSRIVILGDKILLKPGKELVAPNLVGPFRFSAKEINLRRDLATGNQVAELALEVAWLPSVLAFRIDSQPKVDSLVDDLGNMPTVSSAGSRGFTSGVTAPLIVRPIGLKREAKRITIKGSVLITIADEMLTFQLDPQGKSLVQQGVSAKASKVNFRNKDGFAEIALSYPKTSAVWESFEIYWARNNRLRVVPAKGEPIVAADSEFGESTIRYSFKAGTESLGKDYKLEYQTPGPMRELRVPFELKDIPLP